MAAYTPADLAAHLQTEVDMAAAALCLKVAADLAHTYTRGAGFDPVTGVPGDDVAAVVLMAAARLIANPEQLPYDVGGTSIRGGFTGWSLAELFVLNRYRRRAA